MLVDGHAFLENRFQTVALPMGISTFGDDSNIYTNILNE